ncbi:MAG: 2-oxoacid:acceptor oxidoreductase subunit alpha [Bacteroidetes bacterium]|nr:2-oxoacid:acceptor oxidoreductase subunit alpha [Bacteroidota bacterium]
MSGAQKLSSVVIRFAGDSGDGMQLTGSQFTNSAALIGNDLSTFPDYPAEIRAPQGTLPGVSGFQVHFSSEAIYTPGDICDVLVVMNVAALKVNLKQLKAGGIIILNTDGFDPKNLRLAGLTEDSNPLNDGSLDKFHVHRIDVTKMVREILKESGLGIKEVDRCKNMFVLGVLFWMYNRDMQPTIDYLQGKFGKKPDILNANIKALQAGNAYGETTESFAVTYEVGKAKLPSGEYRSITGNEATAYGLIAASQKANLPLFLGAYPITPATDILHELSKHKNFGVQTFQAEDEIAGITSAIGAAFGGSMAVTLSSGPGIALKGEAIGLATVFELPLVICNVQRGGPSTGLPTKTEQADLMQAYYGRNGECPLPIISAHGPNDAFDAVYEASRIALQHMIPVFFLSDGYIANGAEPWKFPKAADLPEINVAFTKEKNAEDKNKFLPYLRDEKLSRPWAIPGTPGLEHRIGGLEKQNLTGNISNDPENHEFMVKLRQEKVDRIAEYIPLQTFDSGEEKGELLILGWGSTYGAIKTAVRHALNEGKSVSHVHLRYLNPFPKNLGDILKNFKHVLVPEMNNGQLVKIIRDKYFIDATPLNKIQGLPFRVEELREAIDKYTTV